MRGSDAGLDDGRKRRKMTVGPVSFAEMAR